MVLGVWSRVRRGAPAFDHELMWGPAEGSNGDSEGEADRGGRRGEFPKGLDVFGQDTKEASRHALRVDIVRVMSPPKGRAAKAAATSMPAAAAATGAPMPARMPVAAAAAAAATAAVFIKRRIVNNDIPRSPLPLSPFSDDDGFVP